jgi:hypothetical protein
MKTDAQRIARYNARMASALIDPVRVAVNPTQLANFAAYATNWVPLQIALNDLLSSGGIPIIQFGAYTAYAGELYHLTRSFTGATLADAFVTLKAKWSDSAHLGASASTMLNAIGVQVFHIDVVPITP